MNGNRQAAPTSWFRASRWRMTGTALGILALLVVILVFLRPGPLWHRPLPDFAAIHDISERKAAFFTFLGPYIEEANAAILSQRSRLQGIKAHWGHGSLNRRDDRWVRRIAEEYGIEPDLQEPVKEGLIDELLLRVDIIPPSMALAQAALESGWGTSRFARQGNNLFGIWCYTPGCGMVPKRRPAGATYEVASYRSPKESFEDYIRNLNSNRAYEGLWDIRAELRREEKLLTGIAVADGLYRYSQEGWGYVGKVQRVIQSNNLQIYDEEPLL